MDYYRCNSNRCCSYPATGDNYAVMQGPRARRVFLGLRGRRDPEASVARRAHRGLKENRAAPARQVRGEWPDCRARVDPKVYAVI